MSRAVIILTSLLLFQSISNASGSCQSTCALRGLSTAFLSHVEETLVPGLEARGMAHEDASRVAREFSDAIAGCTIDALSKNENPVAHKILELLDKGVPVEEVDQSIEIEDEYVAAKIDAQLKEALKPCFLNAMQEAGLQGQE